MGDLTKRDECREKKIPLSAELWGSNGALLSGKKKEYPSHGHLSTHWFKLNSYCFCAAIVNYLARSDLHPHPVASEPAHAFPYIHTHTHTDVGPILNEHTHPQHLLERKLVKREGEDSFDLCPEGPHSV